MENNSSQSGFPNAQKPKACLSVPFFFLKKCNKDLPVLKLVCFCLFFLSVFSLFLFLNVAADNKDGEVRVPPGRSFLGMYHAACATPGAPGPFPALQLCPSLSPLTPVPHPLLAWASPTPRGCISSQLTNTACCFQA